MRENGRGEKIRTSDPLHPMQVRYRAALRPEKNSAGCKGRKKIAYFFSSPLTFFWQPLFEYLAQYLR